MAKAKKLSAPSGVNRGLDNLRPGDIVQFMNRWSFSHKKYTRGGHSEPKIRIWDHDQPTWALVLYSDRNTSFVSKVYNVLVVTCGAVAWTIVCDNDVKCGNFRVLV